MPDKLKMLCIFTERGPLIALTIAAGVVLGTVGPSEVRSPFAGRLEGTLAHPGERVQTGQPIAWLHAS